MIYQYDPHRHVRIWFSNKPSVFMNFENQMRFIEMRETNPDDQISLVYDSSLLNAAAQSDLERFCREYTIIPIDAHKFKDEYTLTEKELKLYDFYKDEVNNLKAGGNLAVASDLLRWLAPVYTLGAYTDFDVPVDTSTLPKTIDVNSPLLLNIGSLKILSKEMVLSNNDYISIVDAVSAQEHIEKVQDGFLEVLAEYTNDFVEKSCAELGEENLVNSILLNSMKNRTESIYIQRSREFFKDKRSSRELRAHIHEIMSDKERFLAFSKRDEETEIQTIARLKEEFAEQLGFIKWIFFRKEYNEIKQQLAGSDNDFLDWLMAKERTQYLKSIVVCTTGPLRISKSLFNAYVVEGPRFHEEVKPFSFNVYNLKNAFQSKNSIPLHENPLGMMRFLGSEVEVSDSSWLESGAKLQGSRGENLQRKKSEISAYAPFRLLDIRQEIMAHIATIEKNQKGFFGFLFRARNEAKLEALNGVLDCFEKDKDVAFNDTFNRAKFKQHLANKVLPKKSLVYAGLFRSHTQELLEKLDHVSLELRVFDLTRDNKVEIRSTNVSIPVGAEMSMEEVVETMDRVRVIDEYQQPTNFANEVHLIPERGSTMSMF